MKKIRKILLLLFITGVVTGCDLGKIDSNKYISVDGDEVIELKFNIVKKIAEQDENITVVDFSKKYGWKEELLYIRQNSKDDSTNRTYAFNYDNEMMTISFHIRTYSSIFDNEDPTFFDDIYINAERKKETINGINCYVSNSIFGDNYKETKITFIIKGRVYDISISDYKDNYANYPEYDKYADYVTKIYEEYR